MTSGRYLDVGMKILHCRFAVDISLWSDIRRSFLVRLGSVPESLNHQPWDTHADLSSESWIGFYFVFFIKSRFLSGGFHLAQRV